MNLGWLFLAACVECGEGTHSEDGACVPDTCGTGRWGELDVGDATVFVAADAAPGGSGTRGRPFRDLADAVEARRDAGPGLIALAAGTYPASLVLGDGDDGVRIRGRCADRVQLDGGDGEAPVLSLAGDAEVELSGVSVTGGTGGLSVEAGSLTAESVVVDGAGYYGASASGGASRMVLRDAALRRSVPDGGGFAYGLVVDEGAAAEVADTEIGDLDLVAVLALDEGTSVSLDRVDLHDVRATVLTDSYGTSEAYADGILVALGAEMSVTDATIRGVEGFAVSFGHDSTDPDTTLSLERVDIGEGVAVQTQDGDGVVYDVTVGVLAGVAPGTLTLRDVAIHDMSNAVLLGDQGEIVGPSAVVDGLTIDADNSLPRFGAFTQLSGRDLDVQDLSVTGPYQFGVALADGRLHASLTGVEVAVGDCVGEFICSAFSVDQGAEVAISDVVLTQSDGVGFFLVGGSTVSVRDSDLAGVAPVLTESGAWAATTFLVNGAELTLTDVVVHDSAGMGVFAGLGSTVSVSGLELTDMGGDLAPAAGLWVTTDGTGESHLDVSESSFTRYGKDGIVVYGPGAEATVTRCSFTDGMGDGTGDDAGLLVYEQGSVTLSEVDFTRPFGQGILLIDDGDPDTDDALTYAHLVDVTITDVAGADGETPVGVVVQGDAARVDAEGLDVAGVPGPGLFVNDGVMICAPCTVSDVTYAGVAVYAGGGVQLAEGEGTVPHPSTITGVRADPVLGGGVGILALYAPNILIVEDASISDTEIAAIYLDGQGSYVLDDTDVEAAAQVTVAGVPIQGNALFVSGGVRRWDAEADDGLYVENTTFHGAEDAAILLDGSAMRFERLNEFDHNGVDVVWQHCDAGVGEPEGVEDGWSTEPCADPARGFLDRSSFSFYLTYADPSAVTW